MIWSHAHDRAFEEAFAKIDTGDLDRDLINAYARDNASDAENQDEALSCAIFTAKLYADGAIEM